MRGATAGAVLLLGSLASVASAQDATRTDAPDDSTGTAPEESPSDATSPDAGSSDGPGDRSASDDGAAGDGATDDRASGDDASDEPDGGNGSTLGDPSGTDTPNDSATGEAEVEEIEEITGGPLEEATLEELSLEEIEEEEARPNLRRDTASGAYSGPTLQFFALHGYATVVLAATEDRFGSTTPQILLPGIGPSGVNEGGFTSDSAIFIGTDTNLDLSATVEVHFIGTGFDPVLTEAKVSWQIWRLWEETIPEFTLRLVGGRFWWPFGDHNHEWFSSVNRFNTISPAATIAVPPHHNETGLMLEGEIMFGEELGLNYVLAVGNGPRGFRLSDNVPAGPFDLDSNRAFTGRLEFVWTDRLRLGFSIAQGKLRIGDPTLLPMDPNAFAADFLSLGPNLRLSFSGFELRSYFYYSLEMLEQAPRDELIHWGALGELTYTTAALPVVGRAIPKVRLSHGRADALPTGDSRETQLGFGVDFEPHEQLRLKFEYVLVRGPDFLEEADSDVFSASLSGSF
ncbi:MAG: hypothetical protein AAGF12_35285 [Myxococcota bacterium]